MAKMDSPSFLYTEERKNQNNFITVTRADIKATIDFLYKRGMWSKYHYTQWKTELANIKDEETLHLWWDAIVGGAMFEVEPMLQTRIEAMEEFEEDKFEKEKMMVRRKRNLSKVQK